MKISFLMLSISLIFFPSKIYAATETIYVYGQHINKGFYFYTINHLSPADAAYYFNSSPGLYGVPAWVHQMQQWQKQCGNIAGEMMKERSECQHFTLQRASEMSTFCGGLTSNSFSLSASINIKFFSTGATHTWTKDNYMSCATQKIDDQRVAESQCNINYETAKSRNIDRCRGSSPTWNE